MKLTDFPSSEVEVVPGGWDDDESVNWVEKYRPRSLEEMALAPTLRADLEHYVERGEVPHLIFYGPAGRGKTTAAHILARELDAEFEKVNASLVKAKDYVRDDLKPLVRRSRDRLLLVFLEEADEFSKPGQRALKSFMEKYSRDVRFIFATNHPDKIVDPIRSRSDIYDFSDIPVEEREGRLREIAVAEEVPVEEGALEALARRYEDMRRAVRELRRSYQREDMLVKLPPMTADEASGFRPLGQVLEHMEDVEAAPYGWEPYTARGHLTLLAGPPKEAGKSTLARHLAAAKVAGEEFLGDPLEPGRVLWVGPDEPAGHTARNLDALGLDPDQVMLWDPAPGASAPGVEEIATQARELGIDLIVLDTLPRIAGIRDENDNAAWIRWSNEALPHIRESEAEWLAIHHTRKGDGGGAADIRGATQIVGLVDIAVLLSPGEGSRRRLKVVGSRLDWPDPRTIELEEGAYRVVEDAETGGRRGGPEERRERLLGHIKEEPGRTRGQLTDMLAGEEEGPSGETLYRDLRALQDTGKIRVEGAGKKGDPHRYYRPG